MSKKLFEDKRYTEGIKRAAGSISLWDKLRGKSVLIVGGTGLIGRVLTDLIMFENRTDELDCHVTIVSRNEERARSSFDQSYWNSELFEYVESDVIGLGADKLSARGYDFILNLASNTHPMDYSTKPIETILANVYGTRNLLDICAGYEGSRFVLLSSVEIYGENKQDTELFDEKYVGYLDSNTLRAGYPESKRVCESLLQAYIKEKNVDAVIVRLPRVFGPTLRREDSKAVSQFIHKAVLGEDIVLKSVGNQYYSFLYVVDSVTGILTVMLNGSCGEAYNVADEKCDRTLREMADMAAEYGKVKVVYEAPDSTEKAGYSTATTARLDGKKVKALGWKALFSAEEGMRETINILRDEII